MIQMEQQTLACTSKSCLKMDQSLSNAQFVEKVLVTRAVLRSMWKIFTFPDSFVYTCRFCSEQFTKKNSMYKHISKFHKA